MYLPKIQSTFLLLILIHHCYSLEKECNDYVCPEADETSNVPTLPPIKVGEKTFYVESFFLANWFRANQFCTFNGMRLASILNQEENDAIVEEILKHYDEFSSVKPDLHFWTSGSDLAINGTYFWLSNGADFQYQNWGPNEPNHKIYGDEQEHCIALKLQNSTTGPLKWNDITCSWKEFMICEL